MNRLQRMLNAVGGALRAGYQEIVFFSGLGLCAGGAWMIYEPAGLLVSGALLVWVGIPTRHFPVVFRWKEPK